MRRYTRLVGFWHVFGQVFGLEVDSVKVAFSRPAHQRVPRRERAGQAASRWVLVVIQRVVRIQDLELLVQATAGRRQFSQGNFYFRQIHEPICCDAGRISPHLPDQIVCGN